MVEVVYAVVLVLLLVAWANVGLRGRCIVAIGLGVVMVAFPVLVFLDIGFEGAGTLLGSAFLGRLVRYQMFGVGLLVIVTNARKVRSFQN